MKKRVFFSLLSLLLVAVFCLPPVQASAEVTDSGICGDNLTWTLDDTGTLTISGTGPMLNYAYSAYQKATTPWQSQAASIRKILVEEGVTTLGSYAFYYCAVQQVSLPESLTAIGSYAFEGCRQLESVQIPAAVTGINRNAFNGCGGLTGVYITDLAAWCGISFANEYANPLCYGKNLYLNGAPATAPVIPETVTRLGDYVFYGAKNLQTVTLPDTLTQVAGTAFTGCSSLQYNEQENGKYLGNAQNPWLLLVEVTKKNAVEFRIPETTRILLDKAFSECSSLQSITIPDSVIAMGKFYGCVALQEAIIGNGVTEVPDGAFSGCTGLKKLVLGNRVQTVGEAFYNCTSLTEITMSDSVQTVDNWAFSSCAPTKLILREGTQKLTAAMTGRVTSWKEVVIPSTLTQIGSNAFQDCSITCVYICDLKSWCELERNSLTNAGKLLLNGQVLTELQIPEGTTRITRYAFYNQKTLTGVTIPASVESIGEYAFFGCENLERLELAEGLQDIDYRAFYNCKKLTRLQLPTTLTQVAAGAFYGCNAITSITTPALFTSLHSFFTDSYYPSQTGAADAVPATLSRVELTAPCSSLANYAFNGCTSLTEIILPPTLETIGSRAFSGCTGLTSLVLPDTVTTLGTYGFVGCTGLESIRLSAKLQQIPYECFADCTALAEITIPDGVTAIDYGAFRNCGALETIVFPASVAEIKSYALENCTGLRAVSVLNPQAVIENRLFTGCTGLETLTLPLTGRLGNLFDTKDFSGSYTAKASSTFGTLDVYVPQSLRSVTVLGDTLPRGAFEDFASLTEINLPADMTCLEDYAFSGCTGLTALNIPESVNAVGMYAFSGCTGLKRILLPAGITRLGGKCFRGCAALEELRIPGLNLTNYASTAEMVLGELFGETEFSGGVPVQQIREITYSGASVQTSYRTYYLPQSLKRLEITGVFTKMGALSGITWDLEICLPENMEILPAGVFYGASGITGIILPEPLTTIYGCAFYGCSGLKTITLPAGVTSIGRSAFRDCESLTALTLPDKLETVEDYALAGCKSLQQLCVPESVTKLGTGVLMNCENLVQAEILNRQITLGGSLFSGCGKLEKLTLPIPGCHFYYSPGYPNDQYYYPLGYLFGETQYPGSVPVKQSYQVTHYRTEWYTDTYYIPESLETVTVTDRLYAGAFSGIASLQNVVLAEGVTRIPDRAFENCRMLKMLHIPESVDSLGNYAFDGCTGIDHIYTAIPRESWEYMASNRQGQQLPQLHVAFWERTVDKEIWNCLQCGILQETLLTAEKLEWLTAPEKLQYTVGEELVLDNVVVTFYGTDGDLLSIPLTPELVAGYDKYAIGTQTLSVTLGGKTLSFAVTVQAATVTFQYPDGTVIASGQYGYGAQVVIPDAPPVPEHLGEAYEFKGWDKPVTDCFGNQVYRAVFGLRRAPGDLDGNGDVNTDDVIALLLYISMPDIFPLEEGVPADFTGDAAVNTDDAVILLLHISMPEIFPLEVYKKEEIL